MGCKVIMNPIVYSLHKKIQECQEAIEAFQKECPHTETYKKPGANTGNYDGPAFDMYWVDHTCKECGKWWREDQ